MNLKHIETLARELNIKASQIGATAKLIAEGGTVPFIARYRKEATGMLDEVAITGIRDGMLRLAQLDERREAIVKSLEERKLLTDALKAKIEQARDHHGAGRYVRAVPTEAPHARHHCQGERTGAAGGLHRAEPANASANAATEAAKFINTEAADELKVDSADEALAGARDIIAERISDHAEARATIRKFIDEQRER